MPVASTISITKNGVSITDKVLFSSARFEASSSAGVGTFSFRCKDPTRTLSFTTGDEIVLTLDDVRYFGGWVMQATAEFAFPVVNTDSVSDVTTRMWTVSGVNYNVLFDRLISYNPSNPIEYLAAESGTTNAGAIVTKLANDYIDLPTGFNATSYVDPVGPIHPWAADEWGWQQVGSTFRAQMEHITAFNGSVYYFDANKYLHFHAPENNFSRWGFSDRPNRRTVTTVTGVYQGATYGFREMEANEDISSMINDVFVWGGSEVIASDDPGASGVVFARSTNSESIATYGRWQKAEVLFGTPGMGVQNGVDARAETIVPPAGSDLAPGVTGDGVARNQSVLNKSLRLVWFAHDVPTLLTGDKDHLIPGQVVTIVLYVHGSGLANPRILTLPLRRVGISFPTLPPDPTGFKTFARFEGDFGLSSTDPFNLWEAILGRASSTRRTISAVGSPTTIASPGSMWYGTPVEAADGTRTQFHITSQSNPVAFVPTTSRVTINGITMRQGADYSETSTTAGLFTIFVAPPTGSEIRIEVLTVG